MKVVLSLGSPSSPISTHIRRLLSRRKTCNPNSYSFVEEAPVGGPLLGLQRSNSSLAVLKDDSGGSSRHRSSFLRSLGAEEVQQKRSGVCTDTNVKLFSKGRGFMTYIHSVLKGIQCLWVCFSQEEQHHGPSFARTYR